MNRRRTFLQQRGFTLVELLVSMVIIVMLLLVLVSITDSTRRTWTYTTAKVEQFREAREAFESITRRLSQATLNTYWDYDDPNSPTTYRRQSELRFISGNVAKVLTSASASPTHAVFFQAPLGAVSSGKYANLKGLINTCGYFIEFGDDSQLRPGFIADTGKGPAVRYRFRLVEMLEPSDSLTLYNYTDATTIYSGGSNGYTGKEWYTAALNASPRPVRPLAENIIALVILPKLAPSDLAAGGYTDASLAPGYLYDSTGTDMPTISDSNLDPQNQLPPVVQITMVAVDEATYSRYQTGSAMPNFTAGLFATPEMYQNDLRTLQKTLNEKKLNYRVFTTNVSLKAAKWSRMQKN